MADANLRQHLDATEAEIKALVTRLGGTLRKQIAPVLREIERLGTDGKERAIEAAALLNSLEQVLEDAGLGEELRELEKPYARQIEYVRGVLKEAGAGAEPFTDLDRDTIQQLIDYDIDAVTKSLGAHVSDVRSTLYGAVLGGQDAELQRIYDDADETLQRQLDTELNTMVGGFAQSVTMAKAQELGFELYEYLGPEDKITREFCEDLLTQRDPPIYTLEEIQAMRNDNLEPVLVYGGGYNCRHRWRPISEERARAQGWEPE